MKAVRPNKSIEDPLDAEEKAKYESLLGPPPAPPGPAASPQGLVAEYDPRRRAMLAQMLKSWDMEVVEAASGTEALKALATKRVDMVLVDLKLPGHDGYEVIRGARSYLKLRDTVFIVLADAADPKDETTALNLGADVFFPKPTLPDLLQARIKPLVRRMYDRLV